MSKKQLLSLIYFAMRLKSFNKQKHLFIGLAQNMFFGTPYEVLRLSLYLMH
jgi:hypothetical protein